LGGPKEAHVQSYSLGGASVHNFSRVSRSPGGAKVPDDIFHDLCSKSSAVAEMGDRGHNRHEPKSGKVLCPFRGGVGSPCNTMWPGRGLPRAKWHLDPCSCLATIHWPILGVVSPPPFFCGGAGSPPNNAAWAEVYLRTTWHLNPSSRLATTRGGELGRTPSNNMGRAEA